MGLLLNGAGDLMTQDVEKVGELSTFFTSVFISMTSVQKSQVLETRGKVWNKEVLPLVKRVRSRNV